MPSRVATADDGAFRARRLLARERAVIVAALVGVSALSWVYMWLLARGMPDMSGLAGLALCASPRAWGAADFALTFAMWWVMMVGMMLPSAAPMLLTFASVNQRRRARGQPFVPTALFAAGYLAAWGAYSLAATIVQWALGQADLMSPMMVTTSPLVGGGFFVAAGLFQLTPLKHACLDKCRSPLDFLLNHWRDGMAGALAMGVSHGLYCLGCCWLVMVLMFVGGVMNLLWMAALAAFVFVEKLFPAGQWTARIGGVAMLAFGVVQLTQA
jgi:predicted metal-binding membrane protein